MKEETTQSPRIGDDNICPLTNHACDDECCPPGAVCNLSTTGIEPVPTEAKDKTDKPREPMIGDEVVFTLDLRGFLATYQIIDIKNGNALIVKTHGWRTDPYEETWQPINKLKLR